MPAGFCHSAPFLRSASACLPATAILSCSPPLFTFLPNSALGPACRSLWISAWVWVLLGAYTGFCCCSAWNMVSVLYLGFHRVTVAWIGFSSAACLLLDAIYCLGYRRLPPLGFWDSYIYIPAGFSLVSIGLFCLYTIYGRTYQPGALSALYGSAACWFGSAALWVNSAYLPAWVSRFGFCL